MTDWSDVEFFAAPLKARRPEDLLPTVTALLVAWDILACAGAGLLAVGIYSSVILGSSPSLHMAGPFCRDIALGSVIAALILRISGPELDPRSYSIRRLVWSAERRCFVAFTLLIAIGLLTRATDDLARLWLLTWMALFATTVCGSRLAVGKYLHRLLHLGRLRETVAVIGAAGTRERMAARIAEEADVVGMFAARADEDDLDDGREDELQHLLELGRGGGLDSVILALDHGSRDEWRHVVERLKAIPVRIALCPHGPWTKEGTPRMRMLGGMPMEVVADRPLKQLDLLMKDFMDKLGALLLLAILSPLFLGIALVVASTSSGPIIFRQTRRGWCGREFMILKFRTMQNKGSNRMTQTKRNDPRFTRVGRFLRCSSLDELPQLWNVLRGDMSLVGPRPHAEALHDLELAGREIISEYAQRHRVKPGLTGWAQVNGARGATASLAQLRRRVNLDIYYIENWSLMLDIQILLRTPLSMMGESAF